MPSQRQANTTAAVTEDDSTSEHHSRTQVRPHQRTSSSRTRLIWSAVDANGMRRFWVPATVILFVQLVFLVAYSTHLYTRFDVSVDFAHNVQAWYLIGHGHLSPIDTVRITPTPFWRDHFDLILWPLSLLRFIYPQPVILLWVQDIAIVAAEIVTLLWVTAVVREKLQSYRIPASILALVALVANSWWYETVSFDIHMPPLGLPFVVLCAYSLWNGRYRRAVVAGVLSLLFGAVVAEIVVIIGIAALLSRRVRNTGGLRPSIVVLAVGFVWIAFVNVLGANEASNLVANYGYLAGSVPKVTLFSISKGMVLHPHRWATTLHERWQAVVFELAPTGWLGLVTPWGLLAFLGVLIPAALTFSPAYSTSTGGAFQNLPSMPFIFVGSVMILTSIAAWQYASDTPRRFARLAQTPAVLNVKKRAGAIAVVLAVLASSVAVVQGALMVHRLPQDWLLVNSTQATTLARATTVIPEDAEVIASYGIMGRFSEHQYILTLAAAPQQFTIYTRDVVFVIAPDLGVLTFNPRDARADIEYISTDLHAKTLVNANGVTVLQWHAPAGTNSLWLRGRGQGSS